MRDLIDRAALYEKAADLETRARNQLLKCDPKTKLNEWRMWNVVLNERSAFKFDIQDATSVNVITHEDLCELKDRFGPEIAFVVNDMLTGNGERWQPGWQEKIESMELQYGQKNNFFRR